MASQPFDGFSPATSSGILDRAMPRWVCALILIFISSIPTSYVYKNYDSYQGFSSLIRFGKLFQDRELPEVKALNPAIQSPLGYDGQFYAQIALDPSLERPDLRTALDMPAFRSQRFFLPAVAFLIGLGQPAAIITAYALLNLVFWFLLVGGIVYYLRARTVRHYLCLVASVLTTGVLISIERSLTDLPGTTLLFYAAILGGASGSIVLSLSILNKPTFVLFLLRYIWPLPRNFDDLKRRIGLIILALAPFILLEIYLFHVFGGVPGSEGTLGWPFKDLIDSVVSNWQTLSRMPFRFELRHVSYEEWKYVAYWVWKFFEFLSLISLMVQASHFIFWKNPNCALWWMGATFAILFVCLSSAGLVEHIATTRTVLPLTLAFNLRLAHQKGLPFIFYFIAGNMGLGWALLYMLAFCFGLLTAGV